MIKGFDQNFLEIESWMSRKVEPDENYPLVLVFNEEINQASFVLKFLEYEKALKKQVSSFKKKVLRKALKG